VHHVLSSISPAMSMRAPALSRAHLLALLDAFLACDACGSRLPPLPIGKVATLPGFAAVLASARNVLVSFVGGPLGEQLQVRPEFLTAA